MEYYHFLWIVGGLLIASGAALLIAARRADAKNYIIQKATPLPLSLVNERDDVWLRGTTRCREALKAPHFNFSCLHYDYKLEERVTRTRRGSDGKTKTQTHWVTRDHGKDSQDFDLMEGERSICVRGTRAVWKNLQHESEQTGKWRHSLDYMPYPTEISAVGSVSEGRAFLEPYANIPLLVTASDRESFVRRAERGESLLRFFGFLLLWLGAGAAAYGLLDRLAWPVPPKSAFQWPLSLAAAGAACLVSLLVWILYFYNTFVLYRLRVENAWSQIDVDLKMRYALIPNLVLAVRGYLDHEKDLLVRTASLRNRAAEGDAAQRIVAEAELAVGMYRLIGVVEEYPDLKAQPTITKLMELIKAIEEKIAHGRTFYNSTALEYNNHVMTLPRGLLARLFGFFPKPYFEDTDLSRDVCSTFSSERHG